MELSVTRRQRQFIDAQADEVLFGGAAGGGKSYGQLIDALLYALRYPGSRQLVLRRTLPELEKSLIRASLSIFPRSLYRYNAAQHVGQFHNKSLIDFGYCDQERDVYRYQSAEYDVIRFDELTHFTESMYLYLLSRLRGANPFPKAVKSATNPGGVGHQWVKSRFIDIGPPDMVHRFAGGSRLYLPSRVQDNGFLTRADPDYVRRLENLPERERRALLYGDWDLFEGQYFSMWDRQVHVIRPFVIPGHWRRYFTMDYGRDMLAAFWLAVDEHGRAVVYREVYRPGLLAGEAAELVRSMTQENVSAWYAPPDMWNRHSDTGRSTADIFALHGIGLTRAKNDRVQGWYDLAEWLRPFEDEQGQRTAALRVFDCCPNLIRTLPALRYDDRNPNDAAREPHELTHAPDAIRYFVAGRPAPGSVDEPEEEPDFDRQADDFLHYSGR